METINKNEIIYAFPRNSNEEIRFTLREYENQMYLDLRVWFRPKEETQGDMRPTRKGLWVKPTQVGMLQKGVQELARALSKTGMESQKKFAFKP